jgi:hypothetical protein
MMAVDRWFTPLIAALLGSSVAGCSGGLGDGIPPYITRFSISPGTLKNEEVLDVLEGAAKRTGLSNSGGANVGHTIASNLTLLAAFDTDVAPTSIVWVTARSPVVCIEVETSVWGEDSARRSPEITAALRNAVAQAFPGVSISGDRCK